LFFLINIQAQDTIYRNNGKIIPAQITEVTPNLVKYKNPIGQGGPVFVLSKSEIRKIVFATGVVDVMNYDASSTPPADVWKDNPREDPLRENFNRRMIQLNVPDYFAGAITLSYEYFTKSGDYSLRVPVSIGLQAIGLNKFAVMEQIDGRQSYYREHKKFSTGFDCNYFPSGQGKVRYYIGPSLEFGWFDYNDRSQVGLYPNGQVSKIMSGSFQSLLLQNGFLFQPAPNFNFSLNLGMGYSRSRFLHDDVKDLYQGDKYAENRHDFAVRWGMNVGYRF